MKIKADQCLFYSTITLIKMLRLFPSKRLFLSQRKKEQEKKMEKQKNKGKIRILYEKLNVAKTRLGYV